MVTVRLTDAHTEKVGDIDGVQLIMLAVPAVSGLFFAFVTSIQSRILSDAIQNKGQLVAAGIRKSIKC
jgi:hypothetical protein